VIQPLIKQGREPVVLLVEDNADHVFLTRAAIDDKQLKLRLEHVDNGEKCLAFLRQQSPYEAAARPDLILLDIHMPCMDGYEVMQAIRKDEALCDLPVVILTTSVNDLEVKRMYKLGCNSYLVKAVDFAVFAAELHQLFAYWFELVILADHSK
jgi:CheY-like chemotaxis protein